MKWLKALFHRKPPKVETDMLVQINPDTPVKSTGKWRADCRYCRGTGWAGPRICSCDLVTDTPNEDE